MEIQILRILLALLGTSIACYYDIFNRKNVPEKFLYVLLILSIGINIFDCSYFISQIPSTLIAALLILFLFLLYRLGQIGGADVFVLAAIFFALPHSSPIFGKDLGVFPLPSIIPILAISSIIFLLYIFATKVSYCVRNLNKVKVLSILEVAMVIFAFAFLLYTLSPIINTGFLIFNLFVLFFLCFLILFKDIIMESMIVTKNIEQIEPEDVLAIEKMNEKTIKKLNLGRLITKEQLERMKRSKIKKWPIFDLPQFLPFILIGLMLYILFGDFISFFV
jgi:hypothetical protein